MFLWLLFFGQLTAIFLLIFRYIPPFLQHLVPSSVYPAVPLEALIITVVLAVVPYRVSHFIVGALAKSSARKLINKPTEDGVKSALRYTSLGRRLGPGDYNTYRSAFRAVNNSSNVSYEKKVALKAMYQKRDVNISDTIRQFRPSSIERRRPLTAQESKGGGAYEAAQKAHKSALQLLAKGFPTEAIMNCRKAAENLVEHLLITHYKETPSGTFDENLELLRLKNVDRTILNSLYTIKKCGNEAVHREIHSKDTAKDVLAKLESVISWVNRTKPPR